MSCNLTYTGYDVTGSDVTRSGITSYDVTHIDLSWNTPLIQVFPLNLSPDLITLNLRGNNITEIKHVSYEFLQNLDLSNNNIKHISKCAFHDLRSLEKLDLRYNQVTLSYLQTNLGVFDVSWQLKQLGVGPRGGHQEECSPSFLAGIGSLVPDLEILNIAFYNGSLSAVLGEASEMKMLKRLDFYGGEIIFDSFSDLQRSNVSDLVFQDTLVQDTPRQPENKQQQRTNKNKSRRPRTRADHCGM